ncbi:MAG: Hsp33 family molecular chaperone HslO [Gammaproteobacteria bacterium]|nr:Hsp33 family molecular chaperone HslO [Gammaproteobacteria bacterium]
MQHDSLVRFLIENRAVRGEIVYLDESYREVMVRHPYPLQIQRLLGELLACVSLLSATLKYEGSLILQIQGDGPISLLLAQANAERQIRGLAKWEGNVPENFNEAMGQGKMAITIDPGKGSERYQGIVELRGNNIARITENYFYQSEQLPTYLFLCADEKRAAGFLVQSLPKTENQLSEDWFHIEQLVRTLTPKELLELPAETILHRLFHQETVKILGSQPVEFYCRCSRDAMAKAIFTMGKEDARKLSEEHQVVSVTCEFCNKKQDFDRIDIERIFYGM